jgi:hypothetical protein
VVLGVKNDKELKNVLNEISAQISLLTKQRTSVAEEKIGSANRARLYSILIAEADNFTRHLQAALPSCLEPCLKAAAGCCWHTRGH